MQNLNKGVYTNYSTDPYWCPVKLAFIREAVKKERCERKHPGFHSHKSQSRPDYHPGFAIGWRIAVQWLAFSISLSMGGLQFRALFYRRATPILGRFLSLLSPLVEVFSER